MCTWDLIHVRLSVLFCMFYVVSDGRVWFGSDSYVVVISAILVKLSFCSSICDVVASDDVFHPPCTARVSGLIRLNLMCKCSI